MIGFEVKITIPAPVETVVMALNDPDNCPLWQTDLVKFETIKGRAEEVGSIALLHFEQKGKTYVMQDELIYCEPGRKYISRVSGDFITARVETTLKNLGKETEITLIWSGCGKKIPIRIMLPFLRRKLIRQTREDLERFRELIQERGADFTSGPS
jgi:hypothetical protein